MEVENELRFWKPRWKPVARLACVESATTITDQFAELILNRNDEPVMHQPRSVVKSNSQLSRGDHGSTSGVDATLHDESRSAAWRNPQPSIAITRSRTEPPA